MSQAVPPKVESNPGPFAASRGEEIVERELDRNSSVLPPIPAILARLETELANEWSNTTRLANLVRSDPALDAAVLKVANSPYWRGNRVIGEIEEAVQRLGKDNLRSLAITLALRQEKFPTTGLLKGSMHDFWRHALLVAAGAARIYREAGPSHEALEHVWTAALFHDLGALFLPLVFPREWEVLSERIASAASSDPELSPLFRLEREILGTDHAMVGRVFGAKFWKLPESVCVLAGFWTEAAEVDPPEAAWAIRRADEAAQALGICWQPFATRVHRLEELPEEFGANAASDPDFCIDAVERMMPLVDALLSA